MLELQQSKMWFPVMGVMGGISCTLESEGVEAKLVARFKS